ncbi:hypothetical protein [Nesterenkonia marinintestina]|uniref:hypothetical protein n=1 Tax=Nesterenkonia marinintestina TaxID=2979865 RepID=UPI0021BFCFE9|nr:hypothetical protein [Nesterenkonia sp. GX14115]
MVLTVIPDLPIHSSVLFAFAAGLFLAALILRAQRLPEGPTSSRTAVRLGHPTITRLRRLRTVRGPRRGRAERRAYMSENTPRGGAGAATSRPATDSGASAAPADAGLTVHWGRAAVALVGVLALLVALVTAVVAAVGPMTFVPPLLALLVFAAAVVALRAMAVTRRRGRRREDLDAAIAEAMNPTLTTDEAASLRRPHVPTTAHTLTAHTLHAQQVSPFDAMVSDARGSGGPRSLQEIDADGLPVDLASTFDESDARPAPEHRPAAQTAQTAPAAPAAQADRAAESAATPETGAQWRPREVPRPRYLEAEKASRPLPEPLRTEDPKPTGDVRLNRDSALADSGGDLPAEQSEIPAFSTAPHSGSGQQALDLDAVLRRRRA